jgi:membrane-associated protein
MEFIKHLLDYFLHLNEHLGELVQQYDTWIYLILFLIIFAETGLVVTPFLPGDSLLFAAGMLASSGQLNPLYLIGLLFIAAFAGDTVNYHIGKIFGARAFNGNYRLLKKEHLLKAQSFYEKHGGKAIIYARFVPIVRTFAPFVAGMGTMQYRKFILFNILGGIVWVSSFVLLGYFLAENEFVKKHFSKVVILIIIVSLLPMVWEYYKERKSTKS